MPDVYGMVVDAEQKIQGFKKEALKLTAALECTRKLLVDAKDSADYRSARSLYGNQCEKLAAKISSDLEDFAVELKVIEAQQFKDEENDLPIERGSVGYEVGQ